MRYYHAAFLIFLDRATLSTPCPPCPMPFLIAIPADEAGSRVYAGRARPRIVTDSRIVSQWAVAALVCDIIRKSVTIDAPEIGPCVQRLASRRPGPSASPASLRDFCELAGFGWLLPVIAGIPVNLRRVRYPRRSNLGAIEGRLQRNGARGAAHNTNAAQRKRRPIDAPSRRYRPPPAARPGYGGMSGCQRGAGARYAHGGPRVCVKGGTGLGMA